MSAHNDGASLEHDPLWYKDAIIYELHVRAFHDSDGDGIGDFRGLTEKLDYLQDLGVTAIWLLPFYPSPLKDDGYDISDYTSVHSAYGSLRDFRRFLQEAHRRGLRVITELVLNHTSDQHTWFRRSRRSRPGSSARDFYVWSDTAMRYKDARIIFKDFETSNWTWDAEAQSYYWHRFYSHQPDLNFDAPQVREAMLKVVDFWLNMGVDGLRLDAVPYLYERDRTTSENLPETHDFLRRLRTHVDDSFDSRMLLAEANQWPEDAAAYFGDGDECHMAFHFPLMPRLFMAIRMEDRFPIIDILRQTPPIPDNSQWALFLRNHDELTLEMVTDEDRDYMYRTYAADVEARINLGIRRRLAPLLGNNRRKFELMKGLLFSLPGTPVIYYGDEIGMGDNMFLGDRNGVRTPMQWSSDRNAGFSRANPQRLFLPVIIDPEYHYETVNVEALQNNPHSLLWWTKRLIALRKRYRAFGRGSIEFLYPDNAKVLAFIRRHEDQAILVVANLSRFVQSASIDLPDDTGAVPIEMFGRTRFPAIGDDPYFLTLGPHSFYWFVLEQQRVAPMEVSVRETAIPTLQLAGAIEKVFERRGQAALEGLLPAYLRERRWFGAKARSIQSVQIADAIPVVRRGQRRPHLVLLRVEYVEGEPETYVLPMAFAGPEQAEELLTENAGAVIARIVPASGEAVHLFDAVWDEQFRDALLQLIARRAGSEGDSRLRAEATRAFRRLRGRADGTMRSSVLSAEQSNTSIVYGDRLILKLFRRPDRGVNPDLEIGRFLSQEVRFPHTPELAGSIEYRAGRGEPLTLAVVQRLVENQGDAWTYTLDELARYLERALAHADGEPALRSKHVLDLVDEDPPPSVAETIGPYLESARLLGRRTAELHLALASADEGEFAPEPFTPFYQRSLYQAARNLTAQTLTLLRRTAASLPADLSEGAGRVLASEDRIVDLFRAALLDEPIHATRTRTHGDYHLGQVLYTGDDFVIIDFEGEPARPLSERRLRRSPLRDVAGMLRSFQYAAAQALVGGEGGIVRPEDVDVADAWLAIWREWVSAAYLSEYLETARGASFLPDDRGELRRLLDGHVLEKAVYELGYELNNRPLWVRVPLTSILRILDQAERE